MKIAFRVDASLEMGSGHVMRCLTLADELLRQGAAARFICRHLPPSLEALIQAHGHPILRLAPAVDANGCKSPLSHGHWLRTSQEEDAVATRAALGDEDSVDWLVVDHYALDHRWESALRTHARYILAIDDLADRRHNCDVLLDQNLHDQADQRYLGLVPGHCRLLLGPRHALLRPEFHARRAGLQRNPGPVGRLLIFFGGMDMSNLTGRVLQALTAVTDPKLVIDVVIGAAHPAITSIRSLCHSRPRTYCHVQVENMADLMVAADLALGAGGGSVWERCALGLPTLSLCLADNQAGQLRAAARAGLLVAPDQPYPDMSTVLLHLQAVMENEGLRSLLMHNSLAAVDALGTSRVAHFLWQSELTLRRACRNDSVALNAWRNAPAVRAVSRQADPIAKADHERWLDAVLGDPRRSLLIGEVRGQPIGVVRFDLVADRAEVSIYLVPGQDGRGLGSLLLLAAERWLYQSHPELKQIEAEVLRDNARSHQLFRQCGYQLDITRYRKAFDT